MGLFASLAARFLSTMHGCILPEARRGSYVGILTPKPAPPSIPPEPRPNTPPADAAHRPFAFRLKGAVFGYDGQRGLTDALAELLETVIR